MQGTRVHARARAPLLLHFLSLIDSHENILVVRKEGREGVAGDDDFERGSHEGGQS